MEISQIVNDYCQDLIADQCTEEDLNFQRCSFDSNASTDNAGCTSVL